MKSILLLSLVLLLARGLSASEGNVVARHTGPLAADLPVEMAVLTKPTGLVPFMPDGAYYVMADIGAVTDEDDVTFARRLTVEPGVATVPGSSFYSRPELGRSKIRFAFPKRPETLAEAARRLASIGP